jgi:hypothetical protein
MTQIRVFLIPVLHGLNWSATLERFLRQGMVIQLNVAHERALAVLAASEMVASQHLFNAAVEALDRPVGLGPSGAGESVLDADGLAELSEFVHAAFAVCGLATEPIGERLAVVGQNLANPD